MTARLDRSIALRLAAGFVAVAVVATLVSPASAQWWVPWGNQDTPRPKEPVYRGPPPAPVPGQPAPGQPIPGQPVPYSPAGRPQAGGNICLQLEQQLVAEGQRTTNPRETLARIETEIRQTERQLSQAQTQLERGDCYEYFLFSKSLRNTPTCRSSSATADQLKRRMGELESQRGQTAASGERRVRDDVVRELARNGCGQQYVTEARRLDSQGFGLWSSDEDGGNRGAGNQFGSLPFATYRTICVRLCDGYYFPVSFSTLPNHFQRDADACQSKCAAPVELYYHQNPGAGVDQAVSIKGQANYTALKTAFRYRKEYVHGCSCKEAEYQPGAGERRADAPATAIPGTTAAIVRPATAKQP